MSNRTQKAKDEETGLVRKRYFYAAALFLALSFLAGTYTAFSSKTEPKPPTKQEKIIGRIGEGYFNFEVADTDAERTQGLSGRERLADTEALLFVFDAPGEHCFWMKDMKFAIDILWFDADSKLVHKKLDVPPESYPESFCPDQPAQYVVEVTSGVAAKNQIEIGQTLDVEL